MSLIEIVFAPVDLETPLGKLFRTAVRVVDYQVTPVDYTSYAASTVKIFLAEGHIEILNTKQTKKFFLFAKVVEPPAIKDGELKESFVYDKVLSRIEHLCGLRWPKFLGSDRLQNGLHVIWMEKVSGIHGKDWTINHWRCFAKELAGFHARALQSDAVPFDRLSSNDLRNWVENDRGRYFPEIFEDVSLVGDLLSSEHSESVKWVWKHRHTLLARLDALPQTICHNDVWAGNLLKENKAKQNGYVLLDWELAGTGPIGADLAFAVLAETWLFVGSIDNPSRLANSLMDGYLEGLIMCESEQLLNDARMGFQITAALRWTLMLAQLILDVKDPARIEGLVRTKKTTAGHLMQQRARLVQAGSEMVVGLKMN